MINIGAVCAKFGMVPHQYVKISTPERLEFDVLVLNALNDARKKASKDKGKGKGQTFTAERA